jgi:arylsulfatase A-like enzyme
MRTCTRAVCRLTNRLLHLGRAGRFVAVGWLTLGLVDSSTLYASSKPNIILVMADDQGWGDMAYTGHPHLHTPNFDKAAAEGLRFDRFYAAAPVCSPTRASVMTGRHPNRMGVFQWGYPLRTQETTLAEALGQAGYATAHFGKWHLGSVRRGSQTHPGRHGFHHWLSAPNFFDNDPILSLQGKAVAIEGESSAVTVDAALEWIKAQSKNDQPFLAVVWFGSPHNPHRAAEADRALYVDQPAAMQDFLGEITGMDRAFGRLHDALPKLDIQENTILWYCSDNGGLPKLGNTGGHRGHKGQVYEGGLLVPAILQWPAKITQPRVTQVRCNTSDIYPTLIEIAGCSVENQPPLDGVSLVPLIDGNMQERPRGMGFWDYPIRGLRTPSAQWMGELLAAQQSGNDLDPDPAFGTTRLPEESYPTNVFPGHSAWIDGDWKLHRIKRKQGKPSWELYNLAADPHEEEDLFDSEQACVREMRQAQRQWLESVVRSLNGEDYPAQSSGQ